jgi:hypothetical protein
VFKALTNTAKAVRMAVELLEGAAKPVGSDAEGVIQRKDQRQSRAKVVKVRRSLTRGELPAARAADASDRLRNMSR